MRYLFALLILFLPDTSAAEALLDKAYENYVSKNYYSAASNFQEIVDQEAANPYLYFNLAKTYELSGNLGKAIAYYRLAKLKLPREERVTENLNKVRKEIKGFNQSRNYMSSKYLAPANYFSQNEIYFTASILYFFCFLFAALYLAWNKSQVLSFSLISAIFAILLHCYFHSYKLNSQGMAIWKSQTSDIANAVVVSKEAAVYGGKAEHFQVVKNLLEGEEISLEAVRPSWSKIRLANERFGWIKNSQLVFIR